MSHQTAAKKYVEKTAAALEPFFQKYFYKVCKWLVSGGIGFATDVLILFLLVEAFALHYLAAATISFVGGVTANYTFSRCFIFSKTKESVLSSFRRFLLVSLFGLLINVSLMWVLVEWAGIHYVVARLLIAGTVGVSSYFIHHFFTFKLT